MKTPISLSYLYFTLSPISITCRNISIKALFTLFIPNVSDKVFLLTLLRDVEVSYLLLDPYVYPKAGL